MEATPERLLRISANLFARQGLAGTSMRQIAREADITQAAIYHHFANKKDLYFAAVRFLTQDKIVGLRDVAGMDACPREKLQALVMLLMEMLDADPDFCRIYFRELMEGDLPRLEELSNNVFVDMADLLESLMEELAPHMDGQLMTVSLMGLIFHHLEARKIIPLLPQGDVKKNRLPVIAEHVTNLLLNGVSSP